MARHTIVADPLLTLAEVLGELKSGAQYVRHLARTRHRTRMHQAAKWPAAHPAQRAQCMACRPGPDRRGQLTVGYSHDVQFWKLTHLGIKKGRRRPPWCALGGCWQVLLEVVRV
jgi:hypothetical protein